MYGVALWAIVGASGLHICEEYVYPGGFLRAMRAVAPRFTRAATPRFAVVVNGAFLVLVLAAAAIGTRSLLFSLSIAALVCVNGIGHCVASLRLGRYMPGMLTGAALYLPLGVTAYAYAAREENLTLATAVAAGALGIAWNAIPALFLFAHAQMRERSTLPR
jgi:hypothetical protein